MSREECLKIEVMPNGERVRYCFGSTQDLVSLPKNREQPAIYTTCSKYPGDTKAEISKAQAAEIIRTWRSGALDVLLVDHRKAIQEVVLPSGMVLNRDSNLLLLVKAFQQWQKEETILAEDYALALKVWIGNRVGFGTESVEAIKNMKVVERLEEV